MSGDHGTPYWAWDPWHPQPRTPPPGPPVDGQGQNMNTDGGPLPSNFNPQAQHPQGGAGAHQQMPPDGSGMPGPQHQMPPPGAAGTNGDLYQLLHLLGQAQLTATHQMQAMMSVVQQSGNGSASRGQQGYRALRPKKDITKITASGARALMIELNQFEIDLGELGVSTGSEAAYRQLRAISEGAARDIIDLEMVQGRGQMMLQQLDSAIQY